jgi:hypothetical protein
VSTTTAVGLRERATARPALWAGILLGALVAASTLVRFLLSLNAPAPWIFVDELIYSELARSAYEGLAIRGTPVSGYGPVYPYLISPAYAVFENLVDAYAAAKALNALVMSLTAVPVYFTARFLMSRTWSLVAAGFALLVPGMAYTSVVMTESAFYPAFALAAYLVLRALVLRGWISQLLVFAAAALCFETRPQGAVIAPAFVIAAIVVVIGEAIRAERGQRWPTLRADLVGFLPTWTVGIAGLIAAAAYPAISGQPLRSLLGAYSIAADPSATYQPRVVLTWVVLHLAETSLWLGVVPVFALLVLVGAACTRAGTRAERGFAAGAVALILATAFIVSAFVVFANVGRIEERNMFYVGVFFTVALCWWLSTSRVSRVPPWAIPLVAAAAAMPLLVPLDRFLNLSAVSDTFGLFLPWAVALRTGDVAFAELSLLVLGVAAATVVAAVRPRSAVVAAGFVAVFLALSGFAVDRRTDRASQAARAGSIALERDWIDAAVGPTASVTALYPGNTEPLRLWQLEFFNRSVGDVLTIGAPLAGNLPETVVNLTPAGGVTTRDGFPLEASFVVADSYSSVVGDRIAADPEHRIELVRVDGPLKVAQNVVGLYADGWMGAEFSYARYACGGGTAVFSFASDPLLHSGPVGVTAFVGDSEGPKVDLQPTDVGVALEVPLVAQDGICGVRLVASSTAVPAEVSGEPDTRALGLRLVGIEYRD